MAIRTINLRAQGSPTIVATQDFDITSALSTVNFNPLAQVGIGQIPELEITGGAVSLIQLRGIIRNAQGSASAFINVPILPGLMQYAWFDEAQAFIGPAADDPIDWVSVRLQALRIVDVANNTQLNAALNTALPGDFIALDNGIYGNSFQINRPGTLMSPIHIGSSEASVGGVSGVEFRNGNHAFNVRIPGSNNIIGGFDYFDQNEQAIQLERGATLSAGAENIRITNSHFEGIGVTRGSAEATIDIGERCNGFRLDHCSFFRNYSQIRFRADVNKNLLTQNCRVDHNYFGPPAIAGFGAATYEISGMQLGVTSGELQHDDLTVLVEYNVLELPRTLHRDPEVFEMKANGLTIRKNIVVADDRPDARVAFRSCHRCAVDDNYLVSCGVGLHGSFNNVRRNFIDGVGRLLDGIECSRWGPRTANTTYLDETHDNLIDSNVVTNTVRAGIEIGFPNGGTTTPVDNIVISNNEVSSSEGELILFDTSTASGANTNVSFVNNTYNATGAAVNGSAFALEQ